jgi:CheY-like chemotaxis protein
MQKNGSILVVDDEEIMREILETCSRREGYAVAGGSGEEGVELARNVPFDAAIVDVMMPGIDGMTTLER